jgi:hypothetical protein
VEGGGREEGEEAKGEVKGEGFEEEDAAEHADVDGEVEVEEEGIGSDGEAVVELVLPLVDLGDA